MKPGGHSFTQKALPAVPSLLRETWSTHAQYLFGIDLFNRGYWWEAHDAWEAVWHASKSSDQIAGLFLQGLIQYAASVLKIYQGTRKGAAELAAAALQKLDAIDMECVFGLAVSDWRRRAREFIHKIGRDDYRAPAGDPLGDADYPFIVLQPFAASGKNT